jgi:hypothetical protein
MWLEILTTIQKLKKQFPIDISTPKSYFLDGFSMKN